MASFLIGAGITVAFLLLVAPFAAGAFIDHRRKRANAALAAEAVEPAGPSADEQAERRASVEWRTRFDTAIADVNAAFDALVADLPKTEHEPLPAHWRGEEPDDELLPLLAATAPTVALQVIAEANAAPTWWSWKTGECEPPPRTTDKRRQRRYDKRLEDAR